MWTAPYGDNGDLITSEESVVDEVLTGCGTATGLLGWSLYCGGEFDFEERFSSDRVLWAFDCRCETTLSFGEFEYGVLLAGEAFWD